MPGAVGQGVERAAHALAPDSIELPKPDSEPLTSARQRDGSDAASAERDDPRWRAWLAEASAEAFEIFSSWTNAQMRTIAGGDHFLMGHARAVAEMIGEFVAAWAY